jgi:hypothetical protein
MLHKSVVGLVVAAAAGSGAISAVSCGSLASTDLELAAVGIALTATTGDGSVALSWSYEGVTAAVQEIITPSE